MERTKFKNNRNNKKKTKRKDSQHACCIINMNLCRTKKLQTKIKKKKTIDRPRQKQPSILFENA